MLIALSLRQTVDVEVKQTNNNNRNKEVLMLMMMNDDLDLMTSLSIFENEPVRHSEPGTSVR